MTVMLEIERAHCAVIDYAAGVRKADALMKHEFTLAHFQRLLRENRVLATAYEYAQQKRVETFMKS